MIYILILTLFLVIIIGFFKYRTKIFNHLLAKYLYVFIIILTISLLLETFIFNYHHFRSFNYHKESITEFEYGSGLNKIASDKYVITENANSYLELLNLNKKIGNIYLDIKTINNSNFKLYLHITDEANALYYELPARNYNAQIVKSRYLNLHLAGQSEKIKIFITGLNIDDEITIKSFEINKPVPLMISYIRIIILCLSLFALYIIRPQSEFYRYRLNLYDSHQAILLCVFVSITCFILAKAANVFPIYMDHHAQYQQLSESLAKGKLNLDIEISDVLKDMKNPYDTIFRSNLMASQKATYNWDTAFYNGKYYVYFGIAPVITYYLPFYLLTGNHLSNNVLIYLLSIMSVIGAALLLNKIIKKYFPDTSFLMYILLLTLFIYTSIFNILLVPTIYNVPVINSLMLGLFGLYFWISALDKNKINGFKLAIGSLCMALIAGSRPPMFLIVFLAIPLFWKTVFKDRNLFSLKSKKNTLFFILPFIIIAGLLMYYNYARFSSPLDFGVNYSLTTNDMTKRGFNIERVGSGLFYYLLQPPYLKATFPFIEATKVQTNYLGVTIWESSYGSIVIGQLILLLGLLSFKFKKLFKHQELYYFSILASISTLIIIILDTNMAGLLFRYTNDYAWILCLGTIVTILSILNSKASQDFKDFFLKLILGGIILSLLYRMLILFHIISINSSSLNFIKWYYSLQFWL